MKKFFVLGGGIIAIILLAWAGVFAWRNLRGIGPAVRAPSLDIAEVIEQNKEAGLPVGSPASSTNNTTGMPLTLPPGFSIGIFAKGLGKPRVIVKDPAGGLLVSIPSQGRVVSLPDENNDGVADRVVTVVDKLNRPHGMVAHCGTECVLVIAESHRVARYRYDKTTRTATFATKLFDLPDGGNHFTRTLLALPDERLLVSVGSSCNVCNEKDWRRATILVTDKEGKELQTFASGLRNAVFMTVNPATGSVWVTEMGRDLLGDDLPPDEINIITPWEPLAQDYGWPYCYGKQVHDDNFDPRKTRTCKKTVPSTLDLPAHVAPLGLAFLDGDAWPEGYRYSLLVAYHGSWNRSIPTGYKVVLFPLFLPARAGSEPSVGAPEDFITGWLQPDGTALGRPVDILVEQEGVMYISDDKAGVIYRVTKL